MPAGRKISMSLISSIAGYLAITTLVLALIISIYLAPHDFSPFDYWIEDYGMPAENPVGAVFYDVGFMLTGVLLGIYMIGFYRWYTTNRWYNAFAAVGHLSGGISTLVLILEGYTLMTGFDRPMIWSISFFLFVMIAMIIATAGMAIRPSQSEDTIIIGAATIALILLLATALYFNIAPVISEWLAVLFMLVWVAMASRDMYRLST
ncbi:MAG TPA: hypothetical protein VK436_01055 [Methanocella sp.]|nr:hypothetical protein [Methanocella sp.]